MIRYFWGTAALCSCSSVCECLHKHLFACFRTFIMTACVYTYCMYCSSDSPTQSSSYLIFHLQYIPRQARQIVFIWLLGTYRNSGLKGWFCDFNRVAFFAVFTTGAFWCQVCNSPAMLHSCRTTCLRSGWRERWVTHTEGRELSWWLAGGLIALAQRPTEQWLPQLGPPVQIPQALP